MDKYRIYHAFPYLLKVLAASTWGYYLHWWRYGNGTSRLIEEALDRESWNPEQWKAWQDERLEFILHRAATQVPFYRSYWQNQHKKNGSKLSWNYLENWPVLEKEMVRNNPKAFVADDVNINNLYVDHTGGTTGRPTLIYESRNTVVEWYAIFEARIRRWHNVSHKQKWGIFGGQRIVPLEQKKPPFWVRNFGLNQLYFSIFHITKDTAKYYIDALHDYLPTHLIVYPSALSVLAHHILELGLTPPQMKVIFCNSEKVIDSQKKIIQDAFKCPVVDTYGMAELTSAGSECLDGTLHFWPEVGFIEIYDKDGNVFTRNGDGSGEYAMTSIINKDMPLIRYLNGDSGTLPRWDFECNCGRKLPKLGSIKGRQNDLIVTSDGRKLYLLDSLFNGLPILEAQLVQETVTSFTVNLVPGNGFNLIFVSEKIEHILKRYLGDISLSIQVVKNIKRNTNGKFQPFISKIREK